MRKSLKKFINSETFAAILLISLTGIVTHGLLIHTLGYYYDDWYLLWSGAARGASSIIPLFSTDRPFMGVVYSIVYRLLGDHILGWHLYALLWRLIGGLAFFWILRLIWPEQRTLTAFMAVLFMVYPGFLSEPDANTKQNHLYGFGTALLSIALMLQALHASRRPWKIVCMLGSIILTANYLWIYEYMIGLEGMRLVFLGFALFQTGARDIRGKLKQVLTYWWPFPIVTGIFLYWRLFIFAGSRSATDAGKLALNYRSNLADMSLNLIFQTIKDFFSTTIFAWAVSPYHLFSNASNLELILALLFAVAVILLVWGYAKLYKKHWADEYPENTHPNLVKSFLGLGAFITLCAVAPVVFSGRYVELTDAYKSYGLHPLAGVIIFTTGLLLMLKPVFRKPILFFLIGISVTTQVLNIQNWALDWNLERETWWQLTWRATDIKNNTLVVTYLTNDFTFQQDYETWGPVNLIYRPGTAKFPAIQSEVLNNDTSIDILEGNVRDRYVRDIWLHRDFTKLLLISLPTNDACIHVVDGLMPAYSANERLLVKQVGGFSRINRIVTSGASPVPPVNLFGSEPAHNWCFYYQKAALARQLGDWNTISNLFDQTLEKGLQPVDASEIFPFLEGLVNVGRVDVAQKLVEKYIQPDDALRFSLCSGLNVDPAYPPEFKYNYTSIHSILCEVKK